MMMMGMTLTVRRRILEVDTSSNSEDATGYGAVFLKEKLRFITLKNNQTLAKEGAQLNTKE